MGGYNAKRESGRCQPKQQQMALISCWCQPCAEGGDAAGRCKPGQAAEDWKRNRPSTAFYESRAAADVREQQRKPSSQHRRP